MKDQRKTDIKVGLTVIVSILLFIWILGWAKNFSLNSNRSGITIKFQNVAGLEIGDNVTVNGVRKGFVDDVVLKSDFVLVKVSLEPNIDLRKDAVFSIMMLDLMGGKKVEILPGNASDKLDTKQLQNGSFSADVPSVMVMIGKLENELPQMFKQVNTTLSSLNEYLGDKNLQSDVKASASNLVAISVQLKDIINENRNQIKLLTSNSAELTLEARDFFAANKESLHTTINDVSALIKKTDTFISKLDALVVETKDQKNTAGRLLYDDKLFSDLKETLGNVKELIKVLTEQLKNEGVNVDLF
ncbi:MAG: ABC transporter substrate-binding protein [Ignavibacteria bacterium CG22_combo_CG10-13_8_21_14_all_37_15]|nr:MAG: ABC transporter substrate-binding protein [Ignavibacteria bacterium CG22_combo_CG10-13_8_21_14_all_37_15]